MGSAGPCPQFSILLDDSQKSSYDAIDAWVVAVSLKEVPTQEAFDMVVRHEIEFSVYNRAKSSPVRDLDAEVKVVLSKPVCRCFLIHQRVPRTIRLTDT